MSDKDHKPRCYYAVEAGDTEIVVANLLLIMKTGVNRCVICGEFNLRTHRKFSITISGNVVGDLVACNACGLGMQRLAESRISGTYVRRF